jgi:hypothetical protein
MAGSLQNAQKCVCTLTNIVTARGDAGARQLPDCHLDPMLHAIVDQGNDVL